LKDQTHTKPHKFALNPTLPDQTPQNKGDRKKKPNEIKDLQRIQAEFGLKKILMNQGHAVGSGSGG
jgi:hypothetical protein